MNIDITIQYHEEYRPTPRSKKIVTRSVSKPVSVELGEITGEEAPVAMRTYDYVSHLPTDNQFDYTDFRWYKEKFYTKVLNKDMICCQDDKQSIANDPYPLESFLERLSPWLGQSWSASYDFDSVHKSCLDYLADYLVIDGELWKVRGEPMYCIYTFGLGHNHGGTSLSIDTHYNENISWERYFNALHRDDAINEAVRIAKARGDTDSVDFLKNPTYRIDVLIPEAVKANPCKEWGEGDEFIRTCNTISEVAGSASEAGLLTVLMAFKDIV